MKKTLIAMAVLAASGASMAQVTLYGVTGGQFQMQETTTVSTTSTPLPLGTITKTNADGFGNVAAIGGSRFGMRGTEDLGGGLSANFNFEATVGVADGTTSANQQLFNRQSWAGLSGGFGAVRLGRSKTPFTETVDMSDPFDTTGLSAIGLEQTPSGRVSNGLFYATPNILGGFVVKALYGALDTSTNTTPGETTNTGLSVGYSAGPFAASFGLGNLEVVSSTSTLETDGQALSGTYDFGAAKLFVGYAKTEQETSLIGSVENSEINVGVTVPMGAVTLLAGMGRNSRTTVSDTTGAEIAAGTGDGNDWVLGAYYNLSKRTVAYVKAGTVDKFDFGAKKTGSAIGIRHAF
jgi:predicted porin